MKSSEKITARLEPLKGKYYGTRVGYDIGDGRDRSIEIWCNTGRPSDREILSWGMTLEEYINDTEPKFDDGWGGKYTAKEYAGEMLCDSHHETQYSLLIATAIASALNGMELPDER